MIRWLKRIFQAEPTNQEVLGVLADIEADMEELEAEMQMFKADVFSKLEGVLMPLNKRLNSKMFREHQPQDINMQEHIKKGGIISRSDVRYGANFKT